MLINSKWIIMFYRLRFKITLAALIIISMIMFASAWRGIKSSEKRLLESHKEKAILISERISHGIMVLMLKNMWQDLQAMLEEMVKESKELRKIRIFLPESGRIVASSSRDEIGKIIYEDILLYNEERFNEPFFIKRQDTTYMSRLTPIKNQSACYRCHGSTKKTLGVMDVEISLEGVQRSINNLKKEHMLDTLIGFLLVTGGFLLIIGLWIERPINRMIKTIKEIEKGNVSVRMDETSNDEFGLLARSFNSMLDSLEQARKEIESYHNEQIQRAAKLASLGEIISGIAHEIKNPLTGISCAVQVFHAELSDDDPKKAITSEMLNQIKRLDRTIKGLLNYARPKPPSFELHYVKDILDKAVFFIYPEANKQGVTIQIHSEDDTPKIKVDPDQIQQVFLNLMINALQAMPSGGALKITISKAEKRDINMNMVTGDMMSEKFVCISFSDTGEGVPEEDIDRIFDPFFTKKSRGTGLGLAISQRIVHEHGGEITVTSTPGKGSEFSVYLPVSSIEPRAQTGGKQVEK